MRYNLFLILLYTTASWGQSDSLWELKEKGIITLEQWYDLKLKSGYISNEGNGWVQFTDQIDINSDHYISLKTKSGLIFYIPDKYQIIKKNGNRYIQAYLFNLSDSVVLIPRSDATILSVENYLFVYNKWQIIKENSKATCGNSYWMQKLEPNYYISLLFDNHDISLGNIKVKQKIKIYIGGQVLESKEVWAMLNKNQLKLLRNKGM